MTRIAVLAFVGAISWNATAQYNGPAVEACRAYAKRELAQNGSKAGDVVFERDQALFIDRYTRKLGSQFVSSVLMGNGAVVLEGSPSAELSFICLLADEKRPVFFYWLPRQGAPALAQCTRTHSLRGKPRACLDFLLQVTEQDLAQVYAFAFQEARERDAQGKSEGFTGAYRKANAEWLQYRDAECARRREIAPAGVAGDDYRIACMIDLTQRRALDMK
jgi:uncharacterized protein YecT (DUF1311 family)